MFRLELPRIARRLALLSLLVLGLCFTTLNSTGSKVSALRCCSPCFNCLDACDTLSTPEEQEACRARCPCYFPCDGNC